MVSIKILRGFYGWRVVTRYAGSVFAVLALALAMITATALAGDSVETIDRCYLVDHSWEPGDYPGIDPNAPSVGGIGATFRGVPPGSTWVVTFDPGPVVGGVVASNGQAFVYLGLYGYGEVPWTSGLIAPNGTSLGAGPSGTLVVDANEKLDCNENTLVTIEENGVEEPPGGGFPWLLVLIPIALIIVVAGGYLLSTRLRGDCDKLREKLRWRRSCSRTWKPTRPACGRQAAPTTSSTTSTSGGSRRPGAPTTTA